MILGGNGKHNGFPSSLDESIFVFSSDEQLRTSVSFVLSLSESEVLLRDREWITEETFSPESQRSEIKK